MKKLDFNKAWKFYYVGASNQETEVALPHDAMLSEAVSPVGGSGTNGGWLDVRDCVYTKDFLLPRRENEGRVILEFEGVYQKAEISVNGKPCACPPYGYLGFYVDITDAVRAGENRVIVKVYNSDQPNCRWYSGTGLYRKVWLCVLPKKHILPDGLRIKTLDFKSPKISVEARTSQSGSIEIAILDGGQVIAEAGGWSEGTFECGLELRQAQLWSPDHPKLYQCRARFGEDEQCVDFGIRLIECTPEKGFCLNGKRVILRGACIHHDNGLLGACAYDYAEYRKIKLLKSGGFNAVRTAHNPCSKALLHACDTLGMLVVDEYADMWYIHKTKYDYADHVEKNYKSDFMRMVDKDYNYPSVIMYSTGNEVAETSEKKGISLCGKMTAYLHKLDDTRLVTCGINIFFNFLYSMGFGVYSDKKAEKSARGRKKAVGSEFFNNMAGLLGADFMKSGAALYPCDVKTRDAFAAMDVAGYNYGIKRYKKDLKKYPGRLILGSETFCSDAYQFWEMAKACPRIVGDFVWAGMDYLGEVGIGATEYPDYAPDFSHGPGWRTAGAGRIDLTGKSLCELKYMRVAFELEQIGIGVVPVNHTGEKHSPSAWKMSNAVESWTWHGYEGAKARVEVYARGDHASLFLNGELKGSKKLKNDCRVSFDIVYQPGELKAKVYDRDGRVLAEDHLDTAGDETMLTLEAEEKYVKSGRDLCYIRMRYTDRAGNIKPLARGKIKIEVKGGRLLGAGSACPYYPGGYLSDTADTYFGEAAAVIEPYGPGVIQVTGTSRYGRASVAVNVK